jgi:ABC-2 type transport system ATP-binding protein
MNHAVEVDRLRVVRGGREALPGLSVSIPVGEVVGLLGPSGSGKTTLMRAIVGVQVVESGTVTVLGHPAGSPQLRTRVGYVTQAPSIYDDLTVRDNVRFFAAMLGVGADSAERAIESVDLVSHASVLAGRLSGGQRSRVSLACALVDDPELLVLDEPTTGLDPQARHLVWEKLRALKRQGVTLLLTTHYMEEAAQLCDRLVIMHEGRILVEGPPRALIARETSPQVVEVFEPPADALPALEGLAAGAERVERLADRWLFYTRDGDALLAAIRAVVPDRGSVWLRGGTLEDVFLRLTGRGLLE